MRMERHWDLNDVADCYAPLSRRVCDDLSRDPQSPFPRPFGSVGRSRLWDPLVVRGAKKAVMEYVAGSARRSISQREAELKLQQEAHERRVKAFEAEMQRGKEMRQMFRDAERDNAIEQAGGNSGRASSFSPLGSK